jgi:hypothetical protein
MDSDDEQFAGGNGDALVLDGDYDSEEQQDEDEEDEEEPVQKPPAHDPRKAQPPAGANKPAAKGPSPGKGPDVKGQVVENQPFDLAVSVNDSEEIDSEEEEDEVNMGVGQ